MLDVGLGTLAEELQEDRNWPERLSISEQQRLAFARILATKPAIVFLDHATSRLIDEPNCSFIVCFAMRHGVLTIISTSHSVDLSIVHDHCLDLADFSVASKSENVSYAYKTSEIDQLKPRGSTLLPNLHDTKRKVLAGWFDPQINPK